MSEKAISRVWAEWATKLTFDDLSAEAVRAVKRFLLDSLGCAVGGHHHEDIQIMYGTLQSLGGTPEATVWSHGVKTDAVRASLLNSLQIRVMDYNDIYWDEDPSHPSDLIPAALCLGEQLGRSGRAVIAGIALAYELEMRLCEFADPGIRERGWHHASLTQIASPVVAGYMMGLTVDQIVNAVGVSTCHSMTMGAVAAGVLTMMKNTVDPMATSAGVLAARLAQGGYIGTELILEGKEGFCQQMGPGWKMERLTEGLGESWRVVNCAFKAFPTEALSHSPISAALQLVQEHDIKADDVETVKVGTVARAKDILADPTKYDPHSKETADHSLPYVVAAAIADRKITPEQFTPERIEEPKLRSLFPRIEVFADPAFEKIFPAKKPSSVEIITKDGQSYFQRVDYPRGNPNNPMSDSDIEVKFRALTGPYLDAAQQDRIIAAVDGFDRAPNTDEIIGAISGPWE